jgi:hypothetical protein
LQKRARHVALLLDVAQMVTDGDSSDSLLVLEVLFDVVLWTVIIIFLAATGSQTNHLNFVNRMRLARHLSKVQNLKAVCEDLLDKKPLEEGIVSDEDYAIIKTLTPEQLPAKIESLKEAARMVEWSLDQLEVIDETEHETVLGFRADVGLINGLITMLISTAIFVLQQLVFQTSI